MAQRNKMYQVLETHNTCRAHSLLVWVFVFCVCVFTGNMKNTEYCQPYPLRLILQFWPCLPQL